MTSTVTPAPIGTRAELLVAIESIANDLSNVRHAGLLLVHEVEHDWMMGLDHQDKAGPIVLKHTWDKLEARSWLASSAWKAVMDAEAKLLHILNNLPVEENANG